MTAHQPVEREAWDRLIDSLRPDAPLSPGEDLELFFRAWSALNVS